MYICKCCGGLNDDINKCKYCGNVILPHNTKYILKNNDFEIIISDEYYINRGNINNKYISKNHAYLSILDNKLFVRDLESTNGTFINGIKLDSFKDYELKENDEIAFSNIKLKVEAVL